MSKRLPKRASQGLLPLFMRPRSIWRFLRDPRTGWGPKAALLLAVAYFIMPVDLVPDLLPLVGWLDDLGLTSAAVAWTLTAVQRHAEQSDDQQREDSAGPGHSG